MQSKTVRIIVNTNVRAHSGSDRIVPITDYDDTTFVMTEDGDWVCDHSEAYIEKACCSTRSSNGLIECGCGGSDSVICPASRCTGIEDHEVDDLFDRLSGYNDGEEC